MAAGKGSWELHLEPQTWSRKSDLEFARLSKPRAHPQWYTSVYIRSTATWGASVPILRLWSGTFLIQTTTEEEGKGVLSNLKVMFLWSHTKWHSLSSSQLSLQLCFPLGLPRHLPSAIISWPSPLGYRVSAMFQLTHARSLCQCHIVWLSYTRCHSFWARDVERALFINSILFSLIGRRVGSRQTQVNVCGAERLLK